MRRRLVLTATSVALAGAIGALLWVGLGLPPPGLVLRYGFPPAGGPTGEVRETFGLTFVELSPGYFRMGSHASCERGDLLGRLASKVGLPWGKQPDHSGDDCPPHWVEIPEPFWIATTEVTNEALAAICDHDLEEKQTAFSPGPRHPAVFVSWFQARAFCDVLTDTGEGTFRLPTEAEWEYACRAGTTTDHSFPDGADAASFAAFEGGETWGSKAKPREVGSLAPNPWGLKDLHGNVWEWCEDRAHGSYRGAPRDGSAWGYANSDCRVIRGGGCRSGIDECRSATRRWTVPGRRVAFLGFRPVMTE